MQVDEPRRDDMVAHIELALPHLGDACADRGDAVAGDGEVRLEAGAAGAVDDHAAAEDEVGLRAGGAEDRGGADDGGSGTRGAAEEGSTFHSNGCEV